MKSVLTPIRPDAGRATSRPIAWEPRWTGDGPRFVDELVGWLLSVGRRTYDGHMTLLEHALQSAALARVHGARETQVVAALVHGLGRPLTEVVGEARNVELTCERLAASWLARFFPPAVTEPIRLYVEAKRWLVAMEPGYVQTLSAASIAALAEQGGPMRSEERPAFEAEPFAAAALTLSRWTEEVATGGCKVANLESYRASLLKHLTPPR